MQPKVPIDKVVFFWGGVFFFHFLFASRGGPRLVIFLRKSIISGASSSSCEGCDCTGGAGVGAAEGAGAGGVITTATGARFDFTT